MNNVSATKNRRILIIDDNHAIHDDFRKILSSPTVAAAALDVTEAELFGKPAPQGGTVRQIRYEIDSAYQGQDGVLLVKQALEAGRPYAMAFVDVRMPPGMDGVETTRKIWELDPDLQVVLCTAYSDYSWDEMFEKLGQHDGLLILKKPFDTVEALQMTHALTEKWQLHQQARQKMEQLESMVAGRTQELGKSLSLLNATLESSTDGILAMDLKGNMTSLNAKFAAMWQFPAEFLKRWDRAEMIPFVSGQFKDPARFLQQIKQTLSDPETETFEEVECKDGRILERYSLPLRIDNKCVGVVVNWRDITARKRAEETLRESEERFSGAFEYAPIGVALVSLDGHWLKVNRVLCELVGYSEAELLARTFQDVTHPEDLENSLENMRRLTAGETGSYQIEKRYVHARGHHITVLLSVSLVRDGQGQPLYFVAQVQDITERKLLEAELNRERDLWRMLLDNSPDHIYFKDTQSRFIKASKAQALAFGVKSPDGMVGKTDFDFFPEAHARPAFEDEQEIIRTGRSMIAKEEREVWKDGHVTWASSTKMPMRTAAGKITGIMGISRDITESKRAEAERARLAAILEATTDLVSYSDAAGKILYYNRAGRKLLGIGLDEDVTKISIADMIPNPANNIILTEGVPTAIRQGIWSGETLLLSRSGQEIPVSQVILSHKAADGTLEFISTIMRDLTESKRLEARFRRLTDSNAQSVFFWNTKGEISGANDSFLNLVGYTREDLSAGRVAWLAMTPPEYARADQRALEELAANGVCVPYEKEFICKDGSRLPIFIGATTFEDNPKEGACFLLDLSERKRLEAQLNQSQKMETVGKLAGGIAHEFNSILTAIIGQSELLREELPAGSPLAHNAIEISKAADRAAVLTRQLLAYGRKQLLRPEALNLNHVINSMDGVLSHLMGAALVDVKIVPAAGLELVKADAGQIEQVIMNMAMNARDAMPHGGRLTMETANVTLDQDSMGRYPELKPGGYVMLAISDTGAGMSEKVKARVFEPFFTTKDVGQGTGLGLSTCFGIIKQSGGHISVYSELGRGTTFKIYLPQVEAPPKIPVERLDSPELPRGTETILLVEDDPALREMAATLLKRLGYTVLAAANGIEALSLKHQRDNGHIDLLFTDVVMPHMSGKELADRVRALYPHTRILFTSAYTENAIVHQGVLDKGVALLQKPFTPSALARKLREMLDAPASGSASGAEPTARSEPTARRAAPQPDAARETSGN
jgi:two-component system cell cycle sensor histidine kinase/response regulator CckA